MTDATATSRDTAALLPDDAARALLVGRIWRETPRPGPALIVVREGRIFDISTSVATMADLLDRDDPAHFVRGLEGEPLGPVETLLRNSLTEPQVAPFLLAPCDLQAIKACGVTFAVSLLERLIEERSGGDAVRANVLREELTALVGADLAGIRPGSAPALALRETLRARGEWSQYLEVGIGPDAEVFTKAQPLASVGFGTRVGLHPDSSWNNPEPEIVLAVDAGGHVCGATLGNDVNLRDMEGRSALLLGRAKDNNASCAMGPFIRLFDEHFDLDTLRRARVALTVEGSDDGFRLEDASDMQLISRDPLELVAQTFGAHHQYPDGFMLFLGTMFSPTLDRDGPGLGFTHHPGDRVSIATPSLGCLINRVDRTDRLPPWTFGLRQLFLHLKQGPPALS